MGSKPEASRMDSEDSDDSSDSSSSASSSQYGLSVMINVLGTEGGGAAKGLAVAAAAAAAASSQCAVSDSKWLVHKKSAGEDGEGGRDADCGGCGEGDKASLEGNPSKRRATVTGSADLVGSLGTLASAGRAIHRSYEMIIP
ncbi:unnamed protein product [Discosporangium mesarthrocarpum]